MPDSEYTRTPPTATEMQVVAIGEKVNDICKHVEKLSAIPQQLDRANMQLEQLTKDQQQTRNDLQQVRNSFDLELEKIHKDVDELKTSKTRIDTLSDWFKWGGLALIAMIVSAWVNLSTKMDTTAAQTANNSQRIEVIEKTQEERRTILSDLTTKLGNLQLDFYKRGMSDETNR